MRFVRERVRMQSARHGLAPDDLRGVERLLDPRALTIGFARRFATYKRAVLVLSDLDRLRAMLSDPERPVQLVFAGKAHPADRAGQDVIRRLFLLTQGEFRGKIVFLEDYDMEVARMMVQGCDVWLNTPRRPQEASGTSGQKCPINGGINCSILDGWWVEGFRGDNGWAIPTSDEADPAARDFAEASSLLSILETSIVPLYHGDSGPSAEWLAKVRHAWKTMGAQLTAARMVREYRDRYYS